MSRHISAKTIQCLLVATTFGFWGSHLKANVFETSEFCSGQGYLSSSLLCTGNLDGESHRFQIDIYSKDVGSDPVVRGELCEAKVDLLSGTRVEMPSAWKTPIATSSGFRGKFVTIYLAGVSKETGENSVRELSVMNYSAGKVATGYLVRNDGSFIQLSCSLR